MYLHSEIETLAPEKLRELQGVRLAKLVAYSYERQPFYKKKFDQMGIRPSDIRSIDDIVKLPFTTKIYDLRDNYPFGLLAVPLNEVAEIHASFGTTGKPTVVAYTKNDIHLWSQVMARAIVCAGEKPGDIVHNGYGYGLFTGGLGVHYGSLEEKFPVVPVSSGGTKRQLMLIQDFKPRVITYTPSFFMVEGAKEMGLDPRDFSLEIGISALSLGPRACGRKLRRHGASKRWIFTVFRRSLPPGVAQE